MAYICAKLQAHNEDKLRRLLDGSEKIEAKASLEYGVQIIRAIEKNTPFSANLNVMNHGLIPTLPPGACVEVPCLVNGGGIFPARIEDYPEQLAALNRGMINVQILGAQGALNHSRNDIFHAVAADPLTAAVLGLDEIQEMTDELFDALASEIDPAFFHFFLQINAAREKHKKRVAVDLIEQQIKKGGKVFAKGRHVRTAAVRVQISPMRREKVDFE